MKALLPFILLIFPALALAQDQGQWEIIQEGIVHEFWAVDFVDEDTGWFSGEKGLFRTVDGAENWTRINDSSFLAIDFYNDSLGWALDGADDGDYIFKTSNGGLTWSKQVRTGGTGHLTVVTDSIVYATGLEYILKTSDGGSTWEKITLATEPTGMQVCFRNADTGVIANNDRFFRTVDGGEDWEEVSTGLNGIGNVIFAEGLTGYFTAEAVSELPRGIYRTDDAFESWHRITDLIHSFRYLRFVGKDTLLAIGEIISDSGVPDWHIIISTDGGINWTITAHMQLGPLYWRPGFLIVTDHAVYFLSSIVPGFGGSGMCQIFKSTDKGYNWSSLNFTFPFHGIHFLTRDKGFVAGGQDALHCSAGFLLVTRDGGKTWATVSVPSWGVYQDIHFLNDSMGFLNSYGITQNSSDGGEHWQDMKDVDCSGFYTVDDSVSWRIAYKVDTALIQKTMDGGLSWTTYLSHRGEEFQYFLRSIYPRNEDTVYCVGERGVIIRISDQDSMRIESGTTLPLTKVLFADQRFGFITGGYSQFQDEFRAILLRTGDGGDHWEEVPDWPYLIHDMHFISSDHGFAVGENLEGTGVIMETVDRGETWNEVHFDDRDHGPIRALHFKDEIGWAAGDHSLLLKYVSPPTSLPGSKATNQGMQLLNHPNPFHTSTFISYCLQTPEDVEVNIYDLSGRIVERLLKSWQPPGAYQIEWKPGGIQPGIYFCELRTGHHRQVIKMVKTR
jgi:photosystem II stability/assembly factor-like uncharacterized protein